VSATLIDGRALADRLRARVAVEVARLAADEVVPGLATVLVGADPASAVYVRSKRKGTVEIGMRSFDHTLPAETSEADLLALVEHLNADDAVDGILVQLPLPGGSMRSGCSGASTRRRTSTAFIRSMPGASRPACRLWCHAPRSAR
jgi:5,10-methylene-tetrahydrofolate dehydrogenase/methenyl tetrahydrofolate cyclohydrolase